MEEITKVDLLLPLIPDYAFWDSWEYRWYTAQLDLDYPYKVPHEDQPRETSL